MKSKKYCCHPPTLPPPPPIFCRHSLKPLLPTLPKLMNWILLSPPLLSSDPDNPPKFETCTFRGTNNSCMNVNEFFDDKIAVTLLQTLKAFQLVNVDQKNLVVLKKKV